MVVGGGNGRGRLAFRRHISVRGNLARGGDFARVKQVVNGGPSAVSGRMHLRTRAGRHPSSNCARPPYVRHGGYGIAYLYSGVYNVRYGLYEGPSFHYASVYPTCRATRYRGLGGPPCMYGNYNGGARYLVPEGFCSSGCTRSRCHDILISYEINVGRAPRDVRSVGSLLIPLVGRGRRSVNRVCTARTRRLNYSEEALCSCVGSYMFSIHGNSLEHSMHCGGHGGPARADTGSHSCHRNRGCRGFRGCVGSRPSVGIIRVSYIRKVGNRDYTLLAFAFHGYGLVLVFLLRCRSRRYILRIFM